MRLHGPQMQFSDGLPPSAMMPQQGKLWSKQCCLCRHAGNLLVLQDQQGRPSGQVGFIDFGIVGRVTPVTWTALEALLTATATRDFETMARALATVGATDTDVDVKVEHPPLHMRLGSEGRPM